MVLKHACPLESVQTSFAVVGSWLTLRKCAWLVQMSNPAMIKTPSNHSTGRKGR